MRFEMKKNLFLVAAVALAAVVSCNKEGLGDNDGAQTPSSVVFTAGVETKTTLVDNGDKTYSINWISGDAISVDGVTFTTLSEGAKAYFSTESAFTEDNDYEAIYPATAGSSFASVTVPQPQEATAGNFCSSAAVSVAKSNTTSLDFKNLTSFLKFQVPADANTVTISSIDDLAGEVTVNYNNGEPTWTAKNTVKSIKVTCSGGFKTGQDYYVSVLPGVKKNFEVRIDGYLSKSKESVEPKRSTVMKMGVLPEPQTTVYMKPSNTWKDSGKTFVAWIWADGGEGKWYSLSDSDSDGIYEVAFPANLNKIIFVLMNGENDWNNKVDQTANLDVPTDSHNAYVIYSTEWTTLSDAKNFTEPEKVCKLVVKVNKEIDWYDKYLYSWTSGTNGSNGMGIKLTYDKAEGNYYVYHHDFPYSLNGKKIEFNINKGQWGAGNQTNDLNVTLSENCSYTVEKSHVKK